MNLIDKLSIVWGPEPATATAATPATGSEQSVQGVATVATVAVAVAAPDLAVAELCGQEAVALARTYIERSPLSVEAKRSRLADLTRTPGLATFWLMVWQTEEGDLPNDFGKIIEE